VKTKETGKKNVDKASEVKDVAKEKATTAQPSNNPILQHTH